jgi:diguanylate cyclase (GGDEF)-like protein/putative nucleotidyltransferase with HDIG domain
MLQPSLHRVARGLLVLSATMCVCSVLRASLGVGDARLAEWIYDAGIAAACGTWILRVFVSDPARWSFVSGVAASVAWAIGSTVTAIEGGGAGFSLDDAFLFLINPLLCVSIVCYARSAVPRPIAASRWFDAAMSAFTVGAVGAAGVIEGALASVDRTTASGAVYPIGAVALTAVAVGVLALRGWTFDRRFMLLMVGAALFAATEVLYRTAQARGNVPHFGSLYDAGWMLGALLLGLAAWQEQRALPAEPRRAEIVVPILLGTIALGVLVAESAEGRASTVTIVLSGLAVLTLLARMALSLALNHRLLLHSRREAVTDSVTGLGNARRLVADLEHLAGTRATLVLLDLNGFKAYNDTFGHLAGDDLLRRIGGALSSAAGPGSRAYRVGGDEFCVLLPPIGPPAPAVVAAAAAHRGTGYAVTAAFGAVALPEEARTASAALRLADERMYADKRAAGGRTRPAVDTLLTVLAERDPELRRHAEAVAHLAEATAGVLGLDAAQRAAVRLAALLHDVGVLARPSSATDAVGRHARAGARILAELPELQCVATTVGACYERWDGSGQPDGLAGEAIPQLARIVFACHAYDALTAPRADAEPLPPEDALDVLRRLAGSSFDPAVVAALASAVEHEARPLQRVLA